MRTVELLHELQQVDGAVDRARERLAVIEQQLMDRSALESVEREYSAIRDELHRKATEQRDLELEVQDLRDKLKALEKKLYGGSVANPKELDAMTKDANQIRALISPREDRLLELYDLIEVDQGLFEEAEKKLAAARESEQARQVALHEEQQELAGVVERNSGRRVGLLTQIDSQATRTYEGLRRTRGGLAVAEVAQRTCQGCRVSLPANIETRARTSPDIVICQSCGRILFATR